MSRTVRPSSRQPDELAHHPQAAVDVDAARRAGAWSPAMTRNRVVLPAPLAPDQRDVLAVAHPEAHVAEQVDAAGRPARHPVHVDRTHGPDATDATAPGAGFPGGRSAPHAGAERPQNGWA